MPDRYPEHDRGNVKGGERLKTVTVGKGKCYSTFKNNAGQYGVFISPLKCEYKRGQKVAEEDVGEPDMAIIFEDRTTVITLIKALTELIWTEDENEIKDKVQR